jgi:hypothetical protein
MKGIVWYKNRNIGFEKMRQIMEGYEMMDIGIKNSNLYQSQNQITVEYTNGDIWKCVPAYESMRGNRANISLVERAIDRDFLLKVILPTTFMPPYKACDFYGEGELGWR